MRCPLCLFSGSWQSLGLATQRSRQWAEHTTHRCCETYTTRTESFSQLSWGFAENVLAGTKSHGRNEMGRGEAGRGGSNWFPVGLTDHGEMLDIFEGSLRTIKRICVCWAVEWPLGRQKDRMRMVTLLSAIAIGSELCVNPRNRCFEDMMDNDLWAARERRDDPALGSIHIVEVQKAFVCLRQWMQIHELKSCVLMVWGHWP